MGTLKVGDKLEVMIDRLNHTTELKGKYLNCYKT